VTSLLDESDRYKFSVLSASSSSPLPGTVRTPEVVRSLTNYIRTTTLAVGRSSPYECRKCGHPIRLQECIARPPHPIVAIGTLLLIILMIAAIVTMIDYDQVTKAEAKTDRAIYSLEKVEALP